MRVDSSPALRPIEQHPHGQIVAKVDEAVLDACRYKQEIARPEGRGLAVAEERAEAAGYDVGLVA